MALHKLNPCPFCNGEAEEKSQTSSFINLRTVWYVQCKACHSTGPVTNHPKSAAEKWNDRIIKNGEWIDNGPNTECSVCGYSCNDEYYLGKGMGCPNCGAQMPKGYNP